MNHTGHLGLVDGDMASCKFRDGNGKMVEADGIVLELANSWVDVELLGPEWEVVEGRGMCIRFVYPRLEPLVGGVRPVHMGWDGDLPKKAA